MEPLDRAFTDCIYTLRINPSVKRATKYLQPFLIVKATRLRKFDARSRAETFVVTYGKANYAERAFLKKVKKAGEPMPVKKIQLQWFPLTSTRPKAARS